MIDVTNYPKIQIPGNHKNADLFCVWVIKTALKNKLSSRELNNMGLHKWWLLKNPYKGKPASDIYGFFVNINTDRPQMTTLNTATVFWNPISFNWGFWEKLFKTLKKKNYPKKGDTLECIPIDKNISFIVRQMVPTPFSAQDSRYLWNVMQANGWELVAQGETWSIR